MFQVFYFLFPSLFIVTNESKQVQWKSSWELIDRPLYNILYKTLCCVVFVKTLIWVTHSVKISSHTGKYIYKHCSRQKITQKQNKKEKPCKYINTLFFINHSYENNNSQTATTHSITLNINNLSHLNDILEYSIHSKK